MVAFNILWKLCALVAFGLSAIATSTDVAQEQPKKESCLSRFFGKKEETVTKAQEIVEPENTNTGKHNKPAEPPKYSVEWFLLPKPESRKELRKQLPSNLKSGVSADCNVRISPAVENRIKWYFSWRELQWFLLPKPENRAALRKLLPTDVAVFIPEDCNKPITPEVERYIWHYFTLCAADWLLLPKPENRGRLREELPSDLAAKVPEDCNESIDQEVENEIRKHFSSIQEKYKPNTFVYEDG